MTPEEEKVYIEKEQARFGETRELYNSKHPECTMTFVEQEEFKNWIQSEWSKAGNINWLHMVDDEWPHFTHEATRLALIGWAACNKRKIEDQKRMD